MIRAEIEIYSPETEPEDDREICFYADGEWHTGSFGCFGGVEFYWSNNAQYYENKSDVELWFYPPERDTLE